MSEKCCICGCEIVGYGNNPDPVKLKGRCCDTCDWMYVIPARMERLMKARQGE